MPYNDTLSEALRSNYSTFSPTDITIFMGGKEIGSANALQFTIMRQKTPAFVFGSTNPKAFARGPRLITGEIKEMIIAKESMLEAMNEIIVGNEIYRNYTDTQRYENQINRYGDGSVFAPDEGSYTDDYIVPFKYVGVIHLDELLPFDIVLAGVDEFGNLAKLEIKGCEFSTQNVAINMNESGAIMGSYQFVARDGKALYRVVSS